MTEMGATGIAVGDEVRAAAEKDSACHNVLSSTNKAGEARRAWTVVGGFEREQINQPF
jgi:hypothetical protein